MTDKKDGPGQKEGPAKAGERAGTESAAKRPHATIDLKAVEVASEAKSPSPTGSKPGEQQAPKAPQAAVPRGQADAASKVAAAAAGARSTAAGAAAGAAPRPQAEASPRPTGSGAAAASARAASSGGNGGPVPPLARPPEAPARGGFGSHVLSGIVGAALALIAAPFLTPVTTPLLEQMGVASPTPAVSPEVAQRLSALEKRTSAPPPAPAPERDPARANAAAEANAKRIEALQAQLASLADTQARSLKSAGEIEARLAKEPPIADVGERLVALERQLGELAAAARAEPDRAGRIPQLAQMTGRLADLETALAARVGELRKETAREIDTRVAPVSEASEAARSATQRLDRELGTLKGETNRLATGLDKVKTETERLQLALKAAGDDTAKIGASLDTVRRDLEARIATAAKPTDVASAVAPLAQQLGEFVDGQDVDWQGFHLLARERLRRGQRNQAPGDDQGMTDRRGCQTDPHGRRRFLIRSQAW